MKIIKAIFVISLLVVALLFISTPDRALAANNPVDEKWWPSEFGPDDQAGATNYITPQKRIEAAKLVKQGKSITIGMPYHNGMPLVPGRTYALSIPGGGNPLHGPFKWQGDQFKMTFNDELLTAEIGQVGTQFDSIGHPMIRIQGVPGWKDGDYMYNGHRLQDTFNGRGLKYDGVETIAHKGYFTRGILIDIPALKGVERLEKGYTITMADFKAALQKEGIGEPTQGDVVLVRTGWIQLWKGYMDADGIRPSDKVSPADMAKANAEFGSGEPGVAPEVCDYLASKKISMIGSDTWGLEPYDFAKNPAPEPFAYCHMNLVARRGIGNFENLDLEVLSKEKAYEFLFAWSPLRLVGATGSPGNPVVAW